MRDQIQSLDYLLEAIYDREQAGVSNSIRCNYDSLLLILLTLRFLSKNQQGEIH